MRRKQVQQFFARQQQRGSDGRILSRVVAVLAAAFLICGCAESSESPEVLVERGHLMESRGKLDEAVDAYTRALAQRADDAKIYYDRGVALGRLGRWEDAIADFTKAISLDTKSPLAFRNRGLAYYDF